MRKIQKRGAFGRFFQSKPVLVLLTLVLLVFVWNIFKLAGKMEETSKNRKMEEARIADLEKRKEKLTEDIQRLNTEQGKEEVIRENFSQAKEGEELIVIVEDQKKETAEKKAEPGGMMGFFQNLFKKL
jgi:cell division protein FtsB